LEGGLSKNDKNVPQPPQPPSVDRKLQLYPYQYIGIPLLILIPILALFGVFNETYSTATGSSADFELQVKYPVRGLYNMPHTIEVTIRNKSEQVVPSLSLSFDKNYMDAFKQIVFLPDDLTITDQGYTVNLTNVQSGEMRVVTVSVEPDRYWQHWGSVTVIADGAESAKVQLESFIFP
jgi:hypothetical protein